MRQFFVVERVQCNGCFGSGEAPGSRGGQCFTCKGECFVDRKVPLVDALAALGDIQSLRQRVHRLEQDIDMDAVHDTFRALWAVLDAAKDRFERLDRRIDRLEGRP